MSLLTWIVSILVAAISVGWPAVRSLWCARQAQVEAENYRQSLAGQSSPVGPKWPLAKQYADYILRFNQSQTAGSLGNFDVERQLAGVRRETSALVAPTRAYAGVLILSGLIVTLVNLTSALGGLKETFKSIASSPAAGALGDSITANSLSVGQGMIQVASAAHTAFVVSAFAIGTAAVLLLLAIFVAAAADKTARAFTGWAYAWFNDAQPQQYSLGRIAADFAESAAALRSLTNVLANTNESFGSLRDLTETMDHARKAIVEAMQSLPGNLRESVGTLTDRFVESISEGMRNTDEHTKQILLIYGQQQHRIDTIQTEAKAIRQFAAEVAQAVAKLDGVGDAVRAVATAAARQEAALQALDYTVAELAIRVEELPVKEVRAQVERLNIAVEPWGQAIDAIAGFGTAVENAVVPLAQLPEVVKRIQEDLLVQSHHAFELTTAVRDLDSVVREIPTLHLAQATVSLKTAAEQIGNIHAQTIIALQDLAHRSSGWESTAAQMVGKIEKIFEQSKAIATELPRINELPPPDRFKASATLLRHLKVLESQIQILATDPETRGLRAHLIGVEQEIGSIKSCIETTDLPPLANGVAGA